MRLAMIAAMTAACGLAQGAGAQELSGTLQKIKDSGTILLGHRESSIPFSYFDKKDKVVGYAVDLCYRVADAVRTRLGLGKLEVKLVPVTPANRIQYVLNGSVDLECGSTSNNLEREKVVAFSVTYFVTANRFVSKKSANLKSLDDLKGKTVVSTIGTTNLKQISELNLQRHLGLNIIAAKDHGEAFHMLRPDAPRPSRWTTSCSTAWSPTRPRRATTPSPARRCRSSPTQSCCGRTTGPSRRSSTTR